MISMMCCEFVGNFSTISLSGKLSYCGSQLFTPTVDCFSLIQNSKDSLSTIPNFGAKLISLYLFSAKNGGNLTKIARISMWISPKPRGVDKYCEL